MRGLMLTSIVEEQTYWRGHHVIGDSNGESCCRRCSPTRYVSDLVCQRLSADYSFMNSGRRRSSSRRRGRSKRNQKRPFLCPHHLVVHYTLD